MPTRRQNAASVVVGGLLLALVGLVPGIVRGEETAGAGIRVGARGLGEVWEDPWLTEVYRPSRFTASAMVSYRIWRFIGADLEVGYQRMAGDSRDPGSGATMADDARLDLVPIALMGTASREFGGTSVFCALGVAITPWGEGASDQDQISGTNVGGAMALGARIDTHLVQPSRRPGASVQVRAVEVEIFASRRQHHLFGVGDGLDFSAWRFGLGLLARL